MTNDGTRSVPTTYVREPLLAVSPAICASTPGGSIHSDRDTRAGAANANALHRASRGTWVGDWSGRHGQVIAVQYSGVALSREVAGGASGGSAALHATSAAAEHLVRAEAAVSRHG